MVFDEGDDELQEWFAHDPVEATRMYQECVLAGRLEWDDGETYKLRWLDEHTSAEVRAERLWEPPAD